VWLTVDLTQSAGEREFEERFDRKMKVCIFPAVIVY